MPTSQIVVYRRYKSSVKWPLVSGSGRYHIHLLIAISGKISYLTINIHYSHHCCIIDHFASFTQKKALKSFGKTFLEISLHLYNLCLVECRFGLKGLLKLILSTLSLRLKLSEFYQWNLNLISESDRKTGFIGMQNKWVLFA